MVLPVVVRGLWLCQWYQRQPGLVGIPAFIPPHILELIMAYADTDNFIGFSSPQTEAATMVEVDLEPEFSQLLGPDGYPVAIYFPFPVGFDLSSRGEENGG